MFHVQVNWLVQHCLLIAKENLVGAFHRAKALEYDAHASEEEKADASDRAEWEGMLRTFLKRYTPTPVGLGAGHADAIGKAKAATHALGLSCPDLNALSTCLRSFHSLTTDMGVEMSLPGVRMEPDLAAFAPAWLQAPSNGDGEELELLAIVSHVAATVPWQCRQQSLLYMHSLRALFCFL